MYAVWKTDRAAGAARRGHADPGLRAILETSGAISTFLYPKYEPASAKDAGVQASARKLPVTVIASGRLQKQNLPLLGKDEAWVQGILQSYNCRMQDVYLLTSEPGGKLYFAAMQEDPA